MTRAIPALLLAVAVAGCSGGGKHGDKVTAYGFSDASGLVKARAIRRVHPDGTESIHGETLHDYTVSVAITLRVVEDVDLDAKGDLVHADVKIWNTFGATDQKKRVILDPASHTVKITRPGGSAVWTIPGSEPWIYYHFLSDTVFGLPESSPVAAWALARGVAASTSIRYVVYDNLDEILSNGTGDGQYQGNWIVSGDSFVVDDAFVSTMTLGAIGDSISRTDGDPGSLLTFDVAEGPYDLTIPDCTLPGTSEPLLVTSSDGQLVRGEVDLPAAGAPYKFVVLNAGSGGADRDELVGGIPRWKCLAKPLLDAGVAVTRYDDRGHGATGGSLSTVTFHQRTLDATAVAKAVAARSDLAPGELFLLGHSEGVAHVSEAAAAVPEVSGLLLVAGVGTNGETAWQEQFDVVTHRYGMPQSWITSVEAQRASIADQIKAGTYPQPTFGGLSTTFWKEFFLFDGAALAAAAARPAAIFQGDADWQVDPRDADLLAAALTGAGVSDVTVHHYAGDGHFVSAAPPGYPSSGDEYWVPKSWDPSMVSDLVAWVAAH